PHCFAALIEVALARPYDLEVGGQAIAAQHHRRGVAHQLVERARQFLGLVEIASARTAAWIEAPHSIPRPSAKIHMTCRISLPVDWIGKFRIVRGLVPDGHCMYQPNGVQISRFSPA